MITTSFIYLASYLISLIVGIFPSSAGFPSEVINAVSSLSGYVGMMNPLIPIPTIVQIIGLVITLELSIFGFKTFKWILSHVPLVGGRG